MKKSSNYFKVIYILTNPALPGFVKIGYANNLNERVEQLSKTTSIPFSFQVYAVYKTNANLSDKKLHDIIDSLNPDLRSVEIDEKGKKHKKEFFKMSAEDAYKILEDISLISGTKGKLIKIKPTKAEEKNKKEAKEARETTKKRFNFKDCGIKKGSIVVYKKKNIKCEVYDDKHIKYKDEIMPLSSFVKEDTGWAAGQGPAFFTYKGKVLKDIFDEKQKNIK